MMVKESGNDGEGEWGDDKRENGQLSTLTFVENSRLMSLCTISLLWR